MPLNTSMVGAQTTAFAHDVDARWVMAYGAGLHDLNPRYMDTQGCDVVAHPVFPVCLEWPVILASRQLRGFETVTPEERARGVHAAHDLHIVRQIRAGERLQTRATVIGLQAIKPGAAQTIRLDTFDESGALVCRTFQLGISRGVAVQGEPAWLEQPPALPTPRVAVSSSAGPSAGERLAIPVPAGLAHTYTECARIWNPIHTDRKVALAAGLPDIILHGTATLALAVTRLVDACLGGDPGRVRRLGGRFAAMVLMPSTLALQIDGQEDGVLFFTLFTQDGQPAISHGFLCFDEGRG